MSTGKTVETVIKVLHFPHVGTRVMLRRDIERYPHFIAKRGLKGTVSIADDELIAVKLDRPLKGAEDWDNEVHWYPREDHDGCQSFTHYYDEVRPLRPGLVYDDRERLAEFIATVHHMIQYAESGQRYATRAELRMLLSDPLAISHNQADIYRQAARLLRACHIYPER